MRRRDTYWCEVAARCPDPEGEWQLAGHRTSDPAHALAWLTEQAGRLVAEAPAFGEWRRDAACRDTQLAALAAGRPVSASATVQDRIPGVGPVTVLYTLAVHPLPKGALACSTT